MKRVKLSIALLVGMAAALLISALVVAGYPPLPASFYGTVTLDGANLPAGSEVSAWLNGVKYAESATSQAGGNTTYLLHVPGDDLTTQGVEGGRPGDSIVFQVNGYEAVQTADWESGEHVELDLVAFSQPQTPVASFTLSPTFPFLGEVVTFSDTSTDLDSSIVSWHWNFGDGITSTLQHPSHTYSTAGVLTVTLTVTDEDGLSDSHSQPLTVRAIPTADFSLSPATPRAGQTVQFTDGSSDLDGSIIAWEWDFGDGSHSTLQHPTHVYGATGFYFVTLTITDNDGNSNFLSQQIRVIGPLIANFSFSPALGLINQPIYFSDESSDLVGTIVSWHWDFDDGTTSSLQNPSHIYSTTFGLLIVSLTVADDRGNTDSISQEVLVTMPPSAAFTLSPAAPTPGQPIQFNDTSSHTDPTASLVAWQWDFGDGTNSTLQHPTHTYPAAGVYQISLIVTDSHGLNDSFSRSLSLNHLPEADAGGPYTAGEAQTITLDASGSADPDGPIVLYEWDFNNNGLYDHTGISPTITFGDNGNFSVGLRVTDEMGGRDTATALITVTNIAPAVAAGPDQTGVLGSVFSLAPATFSDPGLADLHTATIDWGDGGIVSGTVGQGTISGSHSYTNPGSFVVEICVLDDDGGRGCDTLAITVIRPPIISASQADTLLADNDGNGLPSPGDRLGYTVTISNSGDAAALNTLYTMTPGPNTLLVVGSVQASQGNVLTGNTPGHTTIAVQLGSLPGGSNATISFAVTVVNPLPAGIEQVADQGSVSGNNFATVLSDDPDTAAAGDATTTAIEAAPDLQISKTDFQTTAEPGFLLVYRLTITNTGNQGASGVLVTDTLPALTTFAGADGDGTQAAGVATWPAFDLAGGQSTFRIVIVRLDSLIPAGVDTISNQAAVSDDGSNGTDATPGNNQASDTDSIIAGPDLTVPAVATGSTTTDPQSLAIAGAAEVQLSNPGSREAAAPFTLTLFEDSNGDGQYSAAADNVLGQETVTDPIAAGDSYSLTVPLAGTVAFNGTAIHAFVDSQQVVAEIDESNNLNNSSAACGYRPPVGNFNPVVELSWPPAGTIAYSTSKDSLSTPLVINLTDDNGDGRIGAGDTPEIVFVSRNVEDNNATVVLRAINGSTGAALFNIPEFDHALPGGPTIHLRFSSSGMAAGDIDGDGLPEIIVADMKKTTAELTQPNRLIAFEHNGTLKWVSAGYKTHSNPNMASNRDNPYLADLDGNGTPEIIVGAFVFNNNGTLRWAGTKGQAFQLAQDINPSHSLAYNAGSISIVADLNMDGSPEVVTGNTAYHANGSIYWELPHDRDHNGQEDHYQYWADGYPAVANLDADPFPEVVVTARGYLRVHEHDGVLKWGPIKLPGQGGQYSGRIAGGAPTVADLDGDGAAEIGVASSTFYLVYEASSDGTTLVEKWRSGVQDVSSNTTGSTVYDLDGDGSFELIYRDEQYLRILRGRDGAVLFIYPLSSTTGVEEAVVADVDNDGNAEIVVTSDRTTGYPVPQRTQGIRVFGNSDDNWIPARSIWNQHAYHINNVNDDSTIPVSEGWDWLTHNTYRSNVPAAPSAAPDLTVSRILADVSNYPASVRITARIGNGGASTVGPGSPVAFYDGNPAAGGTLITRVTATPGLAAGRYADITFVWNNPAAGSRTIYVVADDDGTATGRDNECNEANNSHQARYQVMGLDLEISKANGTTMVLPSEIVTYTLTIRNLGTEDSSGVLVRDTLPAYTTFLAASDGGTVTAGVVTWPLVALAAGATPDDFPQVTRTVTVRVAGTFPLGRHVITNTVTVADDGTHGSDIATTNNTAADADAVNSSPDLRLQQSDGRSIVLPGNLLTYTLSIANAGSQAASGVILTDTLPANTTFVAASQGGNSANGVVSWPVFNLGSGASVSRSLTIRVNPTLPAGVETITNTARVRDNGLSGPDGFPADNIASDFDIANAAPDLMVSKDDGQDRVYPGDLLVYHLIITNTGTQAAQGISLVDTLPAHGTFIAASQGGIATIPPDGTSTNVSWPLFNLAAGASTLRLVTVQVNNPLPTNLEAFVNTAIVADDGRNGIDLTPFNNSANDSAPVNNAPDQVIPALDRSGAATNGQTLTIAGQVAVQVENQGNQAVIAPFQVTIFEDSDGDGVFSGPADNVLGQVLHTGNLSIGATVSLPIPVSGHVRFAGNLLYAFTDSTEVIAELEESNNLNNTGEYCQYTPAPGVFSPMVELSWPADNPPTIQPNSKDSASTPVVINLTDDNGDGRVNENDLPEIVFTTFQSGGSAPYVVRAITAATGARVWDVAQFSHPGVGTLIPRFAAAGDIDLDGLPEILVTATVSGKIENRLIALEHDGTLKWVSAIYRTNPSTSYLTDRDHPAIADLDRDGRPEIIVGANVINATDGSLRWRGTSGQAWQSNGNDGSSSYSGAVSIAADLDLDGFLEVVTGKTAYRYDGTIYWNSTLADGFPAVGNFDSDPFPEVVVVSRGQVRLHEHNGTVKWGPVNLPGNRAEAGGPPTVADFDGDGAAEISTAGADHYTVFETNGTVKWSKVTHDYSSNMTGSTVFDLDGDGSFEVMYRDEYYFRIYRGSDGSELYKVNLSSGTQVESPVIADVDLDGNAEIIVSTDRGLGNVTPPERTFGLRIFGDANDNWIPTRPIWNQHAYHIDNVNEDGTIPHFEAWGWLNHNTFRANVLPNQAGTPAPDLTASYLIVDPTNYPASLRLTARIGNGGAYLVGAGVPVAFYNGQPAAGGTVIGVTATSRVLAPGEYEEVSLLWQAPPSPPVTIVVVADDSGLVGGVANECVEGNNAHSTVYHLPVLVADAGPDQTTDEGSALNFTGSFTGTWPGRTYTSQWTFGDGATASNSLISSHTYADNGLYTVSLTVNSNRGETASDSLLVTVNNVAPAVDAGPDQTVNEDAVLNFSGRFTDPGPNDSHSVAWGFGDGTVVSGTLLPSHRYAIEGSYTVTLTVTDNDGGIGRDSLVVTVNHVNIAPVAADDQALTSKDTAVTIAVLDNDSDPEGDSLIVTAVSQPLSGTAASNLNGTVTYTPDTNFQGSDSFTYTVADGKGGTDTATVIVTVTGSPSAITISQFRLRLPQRTTFLLVCFILLLAVTTWAALSGRRQHSAGLSS